MRIAVGTGCERGRVQIKRRDGRFLSSDLRTGPALLLDIEGIDLGLTAAEIVQFIHEGRRVVCEPTVWADSAWQ